SHSNHPTLLYRKVRKSTSIKLKKFDKKIALYQGIERKYFNSTVKLPTTIKDFTIAENMLN
ncbi:hypothetical protein, partial [Enterococcus cecorum]|uniref:hypothetical protein n=1 Tax=Enterococcus cecorum TaxID=44008 RepID=UPI000A50F625